MLLEYFSEHVSGKMKNCGMTVLVGFGIVFIVLLNHTMFHYIGRILCLVAFLSAMTSRWIRRERIAPSGKAVFISGCDTGFGHLLAKRLDKMGFRVFAGCLFPDGDGANHLRQSGSNRLHVISLDVTSDTSVEDAVRYVKENLSNNVLWAVVNNAGILSFGDTYWTSMETFKRVIDVNTLGVVRVTKALLPKLKESKGRLITVASLAGRYASSRIAPYSMSKAAAIVFSECLRVETYKWGIQVITVEPAFHSTSILANQQLVKYVRNEWDRAPKDVENIYPSNYAEKITEGAAYVLKYLCRSPVKAVSDIEDAVTATHPAYSYTPGDILQRLCLWFVSILPSPLGLRMGVLMMELVASTEIKY